MTNAQLAATIAAMKDRLEMAVAVQRETHETMAQVLQMLDDNADEFRLDPRAVETLRR